MDLETIQKKVDITENDPSLPNGYNNMEEFIQDLKLMFENARIYNSSETIYYKYAHQLETLISPMLKRLRDVPLIKRPKEVSE